MNIIDINQKIGVFCEKILNDSVFAELAHNDPKKALEECGIDINHPEISIELWINDDAINHFVIPGAHEYESLSDDDLDSVNAAKKHVLVKASTFGCFFGCLGSADIANTKGKNVTVNN